MSRNFSRVLWSIAGVLLIAAGIVCLLSPSAAVTALSVFLGIAVLVSGIADIMIFVRGQGLLFGAGWFLADGVAAVIFDVVLSLAGNVIKTKSVLWTALMLSLIHI